jgi:Oxysterol-binding protein
MVLNCAKPKEQYAEIEYFKRGWSESTYHRLQGEVYSAPGKVAYKIEGRWSDTVALINAQTGVKEVEWKKQPYPENCEYMYGMTHFNIQFNYLPNFLVPQLPPTDTRFRPDQRALENGDFKVAAAEKSRLEEK